MSRSYDRELIVRLYERGWTVARIAAEIGAHRAAIYRHLDAAGVPRRDDRSTAVRPKREFCGRGLHRLTNDDGSNTEHARDRSDGRGRTCRTCEAYSEALREYLKEQEKQ